jgi:hypothetical protein
MIRLNTSTKGMSRDEVVRLVNMSLRWCRKQFGPNRRKMWELTWRVIKDDDPKACGQYLPEENQIEIYWNNMSSVKEIIATCIHEWTHYKQPILTKYHKWNGPYCRNPFEIEARKKEREFTPLCWNEIKNKVNK